MSLGLRPSTWQPTLKAVPRISKTVPFNSRARDLLAPRMVRAMSKISSRGMDFECLMFFSFFRSRGGSFRARMTRDEAEGTTLTAACRFWMVNLTVTRRPFCEEKNRVSNAAYLQKFFPIAVVGGHTQSPVAFAISSPTFFGERPRGPILGASVAEEPTSPPVARRWLCKRTCQSMIFLTARAWGNFLT
jgi:hypothetical protein